MFRLQVILSSFFLKFSSSHTWSFSYSISGIIGCSNGLNEITLQFKIPLQFVVICASRFRLTDTGFERTRMLCDFCMIRFEMFGIWHWTTLSQYSIIWMTVCLTPTVINIAYIAWHEIEWICYCYFFYEAGIESNGLHYYRFVSVYVGSYYSRLRTSSMTFNYKWIRTLLYCRTWQMQYLASYRTVTRVKYVME